ncbi:MAG: AGE family epimerase/isomerase [Brevundimonas sp.]|nr:AGE family epimerase/isomerase [Brevundimonas sp.]
MHLFEAAQAWEARGVDDRWRDVADTLAGVALTRLIDAEGGFLREFFDADWRPAAGSGRPSGRARASIRVELACCPAMPWRDATKAAMAAARRLYAHGLRGVRSATRRPWSTSSTTTWKSGATRRVCGRRTEWLRAALAMAALTEGGRTPGPSRGRRQGHARPEPVPAVRMEPGGTNSGATAASSRSPRPPARYIISWEPSTPFARRPEPG